MGDDEDRLPEEFKSGSDQFVLDVSKVKKDKLIGSGAFSKVYSGTYGGEPVAIKVQHIGGRQQKETEKYLVAEIAILKGVKHTNLMRYIGASIADGDAYIVTELLRGGDLASLIKNKCPMSWLLRAKIARDTMSGIFYLHEQELIHRDIKSENILIDEDWRCVVGDYGFARRKTVEKAMTICGTDEYMAPEVIFGEVYDERADVFSFGVVLVHMITGKTPGKDGFMERLPRTKFELDIDQITEAAPEDCPPSLLELAKQCLEYEPDMRQDSEGALDWICSVVEELEEADPDGKTLPKISPVEMLAAAKSEESGGGGGGGGGDEPPAPAAPAEPSAEAAPEVAAAVTTEEPKE